MELYEAISKRRTSREWLEKDVSGETIKRIIGAGLKAPTHDHLRNWEFVVLKNGSEKDAALHYVKEWAQSHSANEIATSSSPMRAMYAYAVPRQFRMLDTAPCVVIPFFKSNGGIFKAEYVNGLNAFASIWCVIENIFLSATAEGLGCSMRIPVGEEGNAVSKAVKAPDDYIMPCYIGIGYPSDSAPELEQHEYSAEQKIHFGNW
ncbi:MAG: nitroreductase family protein [Treponema sp.]|nr:nitroreductase family protein [Treponema sp.]